MLATTKLASVIALFASRTRRATLIAAFGDTEFLKVLGGGDATTGRAVATNMLNKSTSNSGSVAALFASEDKHAMLIAALRDADLLEVLGGGDVANGRAWQPTCSPLQKVVRSSPFLPLENGAPR
jgi:ABC-type sugar transport system substrate-binding protein